MPYSRYFSVEMTALDPSSSAARDIFQPCVRSSARMNSRSKLSRASLRRSFPDSPSVAPVDSTAVTGCAHSKQYFAELGRRVPHRRHTRAIGTAHARQNFASSGFFSPQRGQFTGSSTDGEMLGTGPTLAASGRGERTRASSPLDRAMRWHRSTARPDHSLLATCVSCNGRLTSRRVVERVPPPRR